MFSNSMPAILLLVAADIVAFAVTNVDDLFVLVGFLVSPDYLPRRIVIGQYLGVITIIGGSLALSLVSFVAPVAWVGLIGLLPIMIGVKRATNDLRRGPDYQGVEIANGSRRSMGTVLPVALATASNGADNLSLYTPLFAVQTMVQRGITVVVFLVITGLWCGIAAWMVRHPVLGPQIRRWGRPLFPAVLIGLGIMVLAESGSFHLLAGARH
jgi:cadmium resistance protein CadD (predicted permease)